MYLCTFPPTNIKNTSIENCRIVYAAHSLSLSDLTCLLLKSRPPVCYAGFVVTTVQTRRVLDVSHLITDRTTMRDNIQQLNEQLFPVSLKIHLGFLSFLRVRQCRFVHVNLLPCVVRASQSDAFICFMWCKASH